MHKPEFITFTGADDNTNIDEMVQLATEYPVEYGILFSPKRVGTARYPSMDFVQKVQQQRLSLAAHICGDYAKEIITTGESSIAPHLGGFQRAQINTAEQVKPEFISLWAMTIGIVPILQCRGDFPKDTPVRWLYDKSGGRGEQPTEWPVHPGFQVGYAGGMNADNVADILELIPIYDPQNQIYWIDMESGIRDENDQFSLSKCRAVCKAVYG